MGRGRYVVIVAPEIRTGDEVSCDTKVGSVFHVKACPDMFASCKELFGNKMEGSGRRHG